MIYTDIPLEKKTEFITRLSNLINEMSFENYSDTPDHLLATYLCACLIVYNHAQSARDMWYNPDVNVKVKE